MIDGERQENFSLEALRAGDRAEFARVVEAYYSPIFRLLLKMLNNPQDAEDALQETFMKAYKALPGFDGRSSISTWIYRIATNEALMQLRKHKVNALSIDEPDETGDEEQEPLQIVDWCCVPEKELLSAEGREVLDKAADELPYAMRVVFLLRDIEGLSTQEAAEVLNISETAVKTRLSRARLRLREILSAYYGEKIERQANGEKRTL